MTQQPRIVTIIQARTASTRLPNKVLMSVCGKSILFKMIERVRRAKIEQTIVVATTTDAEDDLIKSICDENSINVFRGDPLDLLDRHYKCAEQYGADIVVKIPSDCPLIDYAVIDKVLLYFLSNFGTYDYVSNLHPASYPDGNDIEVMTLAALKTAWLEAEKDFEREHTTPFIWENFNRFKIGNVTWGTGLNYSMTHRWTLDYIEDFVFIKTIYEELYSTNPDFSLYDIINLLERKPHICKINEKYKGVNWYRNHLQNLKTITHSETKFL